jgi:hypothetical protein
VVAQGSSKWLDLLVHKVLQVHKVHKVKKVKLVHKVHQVLPEVQLHQEI